jgi:hypothetical protein
VLCRARLPLFLPVISLLRRPAFSIWPDQYAVLTNFVDEPLSRLQLESLRNGGGNGGPRSVIVDVNVLIPDKMRYFNGLAAEDVLRSGETCRATGYPVDSVYERTRL